MVAAAQDAIETVDRDQAREAALRVGHGGE
jgi:hypothetical protein